MASNVKVSYLSGIIRKGLREYNALLLCPDTSLQNTSAFVTTVSSSVSVVAIVLVLLVVLGAVLAVVYVIKKRKKGEFDPGRNIGNGLYFHNDLYVPEEPQYEEIMPPRQF